MLVDILFYFYLIFRTHILLDNLISAILLVRANRMPINKTQPLERSAITKPNKNNKTNKNNKNNKNNKTNKTKYNLIKAGKPISKPQRNRGMTIKKYCANYKHDYLGKQNKALYDVCKINQYCRKTKCKDIDRKFDKIQNNKLGTNSRVLLTSFITSSCPIEMSNKSRKKCLNKATKRFYEENNMNDIYKQVLECDKKICAKERQNFFTNLFRTNKTKKRIRLPVQVNLEDIPDQQMIERN